MTTSLRERDNYDLFVGNVRSALGDYYDAEAGLVCSIALLAAEHDALRKRSVLTAPASPPALEGMDNRVVVAMAQALAELHAAAGLSPDDDPECLMEELLAFKRDAELYRAASPAAPAQQAVTDGPHWTHEKPQTAGVYGVRGFNLPADEDQFEAVVLVREHDGDLVCNLHQTTTDDEFDDWPLVSRMADRFEWCKFDYAAQPPEAATQEGA